MARRRVRLLTLSPAYKHACIRRRAAHRAAAAAILHQPLRDRPTGKFRAGSPYNLAMRSLRHRPFALLGLILIAAGIFSACATTKAPGKIHVLTWQGEVNPVMARYIERGMDTAERSEAAAVVIRLDTPGGLDSSMRDVIQRIESATVPVIVYVSPAGGRAASAGTFITMSANIAAMAPNTTIGAATPISSGGGDIEGALGRKITNDAVAYIRGIAELRGRNADWAEKAVREAASVNETQAVFLDVVDFVATDLSDLLAKSDGRRVQVANANGNGLATATVRTAGVATHDNNPNIFEQLLDIIAEPNIAFLLLTLGSLAIVAEVFHPSLVMGIVGAISLVLAYLSLGSLPTNWAGVGLILFGFVLLAAEVFVSGFGALGVGGAIAVGLGGWILMAGNDVGVQVSRWLVIALALVVAAFVVFVIGALVRIRRMPRQSNIHKLVGARAETRSR